MDMFLWWGSVFRTLKHYVHKQLIHLLHVRKIILKNTTKIKMIYSTKQRKYNEAPEQTIFLY